VSSVFSTQNWPISGWEDFYYTLCNFLCKFCSVAQSPFVTATPTRKEEGPCLWSQSYLSPTTMLLILLLIMALKFSNTLKYSQTFETLSFGHLGRLEFFWTHFSQECRKCGLWTLSRTLLHLWGLLEQFPAHTCSVAFSQFNSGTQIEPSSTHIWYYLYSTLTSCTQRLYLVVNCVL